MENSEAEQGSSASHTSEIWHISWYQHAIRILIRWKFSLPIFIATFGFLWTTVEAYAVIVDDSFKGLDEYFALICLSVVFALAIRSYQYLTAIPEGFENETKEIQRIVRIQRKRWQFVLVKQLLNNRVSKVKRLFQDMSEGRLLLSRNHLTGRVCCAPLLG